MRFPTKKPHQFINIVRRRNLTLQLILNWDDDIKILPGRHNPTAIRKSAQRYGPGTLSHIAESPIEVILRKERLAPHGPLVEPIYVIVTIFSHYKTTLDLHDLTHKVKFRNFDRKITVFFSFYQIFRCQNTKKPHFHPNNQQKYKIKSA